MFGNWTNQATIGNLHSLIRLKKLLYMYYFIYAINLSIINKNTVYTRLCPGDRRKVNLDHGY